jgi:hypothetical protein
MSAQVSSMVELVAGIRDAFVRTLVSVASNAGVGRGDYVSARPTTVNGCEWSALLLRSRSGCAAPSWPAAPSSARRLSRT